MDSISVIVPIYHGEKYISDMIFQIEQCKKRLTVETYIEIIFVNDAPDTPLTNKWKSEVVDIFIINSEKNEGIHGARVKGLLSSKGEYVLFLDQDDKIQPEYFNSQFHMIGENDAVICKAIHAGKEFYTGNIFFENVVSKEYVLSRWNLIVSPGQVLIRRNSIPQVWIENVMKYNGADDWLLWISMMAEELKFSLNSDILYEHVVQDKNTSNDIMSMVQSEQEVIRIVLKEHILQEKDVHLLMEGFFLKNLNRTQELYFFRQKLDILEKLKKRTGKTREYFECLRSQGLQSIAIYGCGIVGKCLFDELQEYIDIKYFIDRNASEIQTQIPVYTLFDELPVVDAVIITLTDETEIPNIKNTIRQKFATKFLLLKDWLM